MRTRLEIGAALRALRLARGLSQEQVARALGMGNTGVSAIEVGVSGASIDRLALFAEKCGGALGVYVVPEAQAEAWERFTAFIAQGDESLLRDLGRILKLLPALTVRERGMLIYMLERLVAGSSSESSP